MKKNVCLFIQKDGLRCMRPEKLDCKCPGRCDMFTEDLTDLFIPEQVQEEKTEA